MALKKFSTVKDLWYLIKVICLIVNDPKYNDSDKIEAIKSEVEWFLKNYEPWR